MKLETKQKISVEISPEDVARLFFDMESNEHAVFFNRVAELFGGGSSIYNLVMQMEYTSQRPELTDTGRVAMSIIGNYSEKR